MWRQRGCCVAADGLDSMDTSAEGCNVHRISEVVVALELTTRPRARARRSRRIVVRVAGLLLVAIALSFVVPVAAGLSFHAVTDDAMAGTIEKGSAVITEPVPVADLEIGDVITYPKISRDGTATLLTRRIAAIDAAVYRTSGDSTGDLDPWTVTIDDPSQDVVVAHVPVAGYVVDGPARAWIVLLLMLVVAIVSLERVMLTRRERLDLLGALTLPVDGVAARGTEVPAQRSAAAPAGPSSERPVGLHPADRRPSLGWDSPQATDSA